MNRIVWRFAGRFAGTALDTPGSIGKPILKENQSRRGVQLYNIGTGRVFLREEPVPIETTTGFPIRSGDASSLAGTSPFAPQNELYAVAEAGYDLYVAELVEEDPAEHRGV